MHKAVQEVKEKHVYQKVLMEKINIEKGSSTGGDKESESADVGIKEKGNKRKRGNKRRAIVTLRRAIVTLRWPWLLWAFMGLRWPLLAFVGRRWLLGNKNKIKILYIKKITHLGPFFPLLPIKTPFDDLIHK